MDYFEKLLQEVKQEVEQETKKTQLKDQQEKQAQQVRMQALREKEAQDFLRTLTPNSKDARWFEQFATHYATRQEAAIAYLQSLRELDP
jgi:hypothetical protein